MMIRILRLDLSLSERRICYCLLAFFYFLLPNDRPDFSIFNSHDSESYLVLSYSLIQGDGYTRNIDWVYIPHTLWPPGMPSLLIPAVLASGDKVNWLWVKFTVITISLLGLYLLWRLIVCYTGNFRLANLSVLMFGLPPYFWHFSRIALAESVVLVWFIFALLVIHFYLQPAKINVKNAALSGLFCGAGMMIKGTVIGLVLVPLIYSYQRWRAGAKLPHLITVLTVFALFFSCSSVCGVCAMPLSTAAVSAWMA